MKLETLEALKSFVIHVKCNVFDDDIDIAASKLESLLESEIEIQKKRDDFSEFLNRQLS